MRRRQFMQATLLTLPRPAASAPAAPSPVVLELFTSQACSSCPPADALLGQLIGRPEIIGLAWHVDYWNGAGWRDGFARRAWTDRQTTYAKLLGAEVYTPALVVNGAAMVIGSNRAAVERAVSQAMPPPIVVALRRTGSGLQAEIGAADPSITGLLVTYDPRQSTQIDGGENGGRLLVEYRVVREAVSVPTASTIVLPPLSPMLGAALLLQDASWHVVGAADLLPTRG